MLSRQRVALITGSFLTGIIGYAYYIVKIKNPYPESVRNPLRKALMSERQKDLVTAERYLKQSIEKALETMDPYSRPVVGLYERLADFKTRICPTCSDSVDTYYKVWSILCQSTNVSIKKWSVEIAMIMTDLFIKKKDYECAEIMSEWATQTLVGFPTQPFEISRKLKERLDKESYEHVFDIEFPNISLPKPTQMTLTPVPWSNAEELSSAVEQLASIYALTSRFELSAAMHYQLLNLVNQSHVSQFEKQCRLATVSNQLAHDFLAMKRMKEASQWAHHGLSHSEKAGKDCDHCRLASLTLLKNLKS